MLSRFFLPVVPWAVFNPVCVFSFKRMFSCKDVLLLGSLLAKFILLAANLLPGNPIQSYPTCTLKLSNAFSLPINILQCPQDTEKSAPGPRSSHPNQWSDQFTIPLGAQPNLPTWVPPLAKLSVSVIAFIHAFSLTRKFFHLLLFSLLSQPESLSWDVADLEMLFPTPSHI